MDRIGFKRVERKDAEKTKRKLLSEGLLNTDYLIEKDANFVYFPLLKGKGDIEMEARKRKNVPTIKEVIGKSVRYEIIGDLCIVDIPSEVDENKVAEHILRFHKNIKGIFKKTSAIEGIYRTREVDYIKGENRTTTWHRENGCWIYVDIANVHFSPRMAEERKNIIEKINEGSKVVVMFSGAGPYAIEIAKHKKAEVVAIEINKKAVECMRKGVERNKCNVIMVEGDVKEKASEFQSWADYVVMPLPAHSEEYIKEAIQMLNKKGKIFLYAFWKRGNENEMVKKLEDKLKEFAKDARCVWRRVKSYSPSINKVCCECEVEKIYIKKLNRI